MAGGDSLLVRLEQTEQITLHLLENDQGREHWNLGEEVTQKGICEATGLSRKHISRPLDRLESLGILDKEHARPEGYRQRVLVYRLTPSGLASAEELRERVLSSTVQVGDESISLGELLKDSPSLISGLRGHDTHGTVIDPSAKPSSTSGEKLLRGVIQTAFKDGILSDDERTLIDELVEQLDMSTIGLKQIIDEERKSLEGLSNEAEEVYVQMLDTVWADIGADSSTPALLDALAESLRLTPQNRLRLEAITRKRHGLLTTFPPIQRAYVEAIWTAMADGGISLEEDAILRSLRSSLEIDTALHTQIVEAVRLVISEP